MRDITATEGKLLSASCCMFAKVSWFMKQTWSYLFAGNCNNMTDFLWGCISFFWIPNNLYMKVLFFLFPSSVSLSFSQYIWFVVKLLHHLWTLTMLTASLQLCQCSFQIISFHLQSLQLDNGPLKTSCTCYSFLHTVDLCQTFLHTYIHFEMCVACAAQHLPTCSVTYSAYWPLYSMLQ